MVAVFTVITGAFVVAGAAASLWQAMKQSEDFKRALIEQRAEERTAAEAEAEQMRQEAAISAATKKKAEAKKMGDMGMIAAIIGIVVITAILYSG